jgi:hypothetical protein
MTMRIWPRLLVLILMFEVHAGAAKRIYETGKLVNVTPKYIESPALLDEKLLPPPQIVVGNSFEIQVGDLAYFVDAVLCCPLRSKYKPEWTAGTPIEFRFDKENMFIRRPNGKEVRARLVKVGHATENPRAPIVRAPTQLQAFTEPAKHDKTVPLGIDFLRAGDTCLIFDGDVIAGDFFNDLRARRTPNGIDFRKKGQKVETYPQKVMVRIFAALGVCSSKERSPEGSTPRDALFDEDFMRSVTFEGAWKHGFDERAADLGPLVEGRIPNPTALPTNRAWWEYEFEVRSEGVRLNDALVIVIQSPDGRLVARLSVRLPNG